MKIIVKPATTIPQIIKLQKVAAYCRVSTLQEIQHHSLVAQQQYYEQMIRSRSDWIFVGVYADQASGRNNLKMRAFQQMIEDCRKGKIDLIIVKSISRMGRNTVQFLQLCKELKSLDVDVFFEVEKLHLHDPKTELILSIYASLYQNESESKSFAVRWGIRARFAGGTSGFINRPCYGYRQEADTLVPVPEEAEIVRLIYKWHKQGKSLRKIASALADMGVRSPRNKPTWSIETIRKILNNEKYYGNVLLQKTYVSNYFTGKQSPNCGEYAKYLIEEHHPAIIKE